MKKINWLMVTSSLGNWGETDGVVTTYQNLIPFLVKNNFLVDILTYGPKNKVEKRGSVTIITHRPVLPLRVDPARWIDLGLRISLTARELTRRRFQLVVSSTPDPLGWLAVSLAKKNKCPLVSLYHTELADYTQIRVSQVLGKLAGQTAKNLMSGWLQAYYNQSNLILAPSKFAQKKIKKIFKPKVKIFTRGVDLKLFHPRYRTRKGGLTQALYVGRVTPEKNLDVLAKIFKDREDVKLKIVGNGIYLPQLKRILPQAEYPGRLTGRRLSSAYANADFFVFPSETDTLGVVVLEAMASGLPVIVTNKGGPRELVKNGKTGFVAGSDKKFAKAVDVLINDEFRRKKMGQKARAYAEKNSWEKRFQQLLRALRSVL